MMKAIIGRVTAGGRRSRNSPPIDATANVGSASHARGHAGPTGRPTLFKTGWKLGERWPSRLVATAAEERLSFWRSQPAQKEGPARLKGGAKLLWGAERRGSAQSATNAIRFAGGRF